MCVYGSDPLWIKANGNYEKYTELTSIRSQTDQKRLCDALTDMKMRELSQSASK